MFYLISGLIIFFGLHLLPTSVKLREGLIDRLGKWPYLGAFSAISMLGFLLIIYGYSLSEGTTLWEPFAFGRNLSLSLMPIAFILVVAAYLKSHVRARLKHPMLIGTAIWAALHLLSTGRSTSVLLFGSFLAYSIADMILAKPRENLIPSGRPSAIHDLLALISGLAAYAAMLYLHGLLFGTAIVNYAGAEGGPI